MGFRKIIGFGDGSFVVSLPKDWVVKNGLKKGEVISVEEEGNLLKVGPYNVKPNQDKREITIECDCKKGMKEFKSRLTYAYINNYNLINVKMLNSAGCSTKLKEIINNFVGLDLIEEKKDRIIINDILNISGMSIYNLLRRMDRIIISMAEDAKSILEGKTKKNSSLDERDEDVNKICNLILKLLRRAHNVNDMKILNLTVDEIFYYWDITVDMENVADQLKRIVRVYGGKANNEIINVFDNAMDHYNTSMKANYVKDNDLAISVMIKRKDFFNQCEEISKNLSLEEVFMLEKIKSIHFFSGNIAKSLLKLGVPAK